MQNLYLLTALAFSKGILISYLILKSRTINKLEFEELKDRFSKKELHRAFEDRKVNMLNYRKEFFNVSLDELKQKLDKLEEKDKEKSYRVSYSGSFDSVTPLYRLIDKEKLGTKR